MIRHRQSGKVRSAAGAGEDHVGLVVGQRHLLDGLEADDGLMQHDVVQYAAQRVLGVRVRGGDLDGLGDGDAQRAVGVGMLGQDCASGLGLHARAGGDGRAEDLHQGAAVGLLVVADAHHEDLALHSEEGAGHGQRRAPLARAGLGGEALGAVLFVIKRLRDGGVRLVRAGRAYALVLVVDVGWGVESLLQTAGAEERRWTPLRVDLSHRAGNLDLALGADLLQDEAHGKERGEIVGAERLQRSGVQGRRHGLRQVGCDVVPGERDAALRQVILDSFHAQHSTVLESRPAAVERLNTDLHR